jgi:hypothetical protein
MLIEKLESASEKPENQPLLSIKELSRGLSSRG